jgi:hypothetical protein
MVVNYYFQAGKYITSQSKRSKNTRSTALSFAKDISLSTFTGIQTGEKLTAPGVAVSLRHGVQEILRENWGFKSLGPRLLLAS